MLKTYYVFIFLIIYIACFTVFYSDASPEKSRICIEKSTGKLIEYQSGNAPLGTLIKNAENAGYNANDVEEKYITKDEWSVIKDEQIKKPAKEKAELKELDRKQKEEMIKIKLNLTNQEFKDLREALRD